MKKFVAVITSRDEYGVENADPYFTFNAKSKVDALRIAKQIALQKFSDWANVIVVVDSVTRQKQKALWAGVLEALARYRNAPRGVLEAYFDWRAISVLENQIEHWGNPYFNPNHDAALFKPPA